MCIRDRPVPAEHHPGPVLYPHRPGGPAVGGKGYPDGGPGGDRPEPLRLGGGLPLCRHRRGGRDGGLRAGQDVYKRQIFDLVVTSPPYNIGKEYENQVPLSDYYDWQKRIIEKIYPRLKDNGSICWQVGNYVEKGSITPLDIELAPIFKALNLHLRNRIIWQDVYKRQD